MSGRPWQDITYADVIAEALQRHGERIAFISGDRRMTYSEAVDVTGRMIQVLSAHGVTRGGGVIALSPNTPEVYLLQAAAYLLGAHFSGLHALGSRDDHVHVATDSEATLLVVSPSYSEAGEEIFRRAGTVEHLFTFGPASTGRDLLALLADVEPAPLTGHGVERTTSHGCSTPAAPRACRRA